MEGIETPIVGDFGEVESVGVDRERPVVAERAGCRILANLPSSAEIRPSIIAFMSA